MVCYRTVTNIVGIKGEDQMRKVIEIRAAEGGEDSKLFVSDLATAYSKLGTKLG
jgi:protein subunit release factor A